MFIQVFGECPSITLRYPFPTGEKPRFEEELLVDCGEWRWEYREGPNLEYTTELVYVPASLSKMPVERFVETEQYKRTAESNWKERGQYAILKEEIEMFTVSFELRFDNYDVGLWSNGLCYFAFDTRVPTVLKTCHSKCFAEFWVHNIGHGVNRGPYTEQLYDNLWDRDMPDEYEEAFTFFSDDNILWFVLVNTEGDECKLAFYSAERFFKEYPGKFQCIMDAFEVYSLPATAQLLRLAREHIAYAY